MTGPDALDQEVLGHLATHVGITGLLGDEHTREVTIGLVNTVDGELNVTLEHVELLVVLAEHLLVAVNTVLDAWEGTCLVVAGGGTTALGVKEEASAVGRDGERAAHLEARLDLVTVAGGHQLLHGEEERHTLTARGLDGGGGVVNAVVLEDRGLAVDVLQLSTDTIKGVRLAGHQLGVDVVRGDLALLVGDLFLHLPGCGLDAHIRQEHLAVDGDGTSANDLRATVGQARTLDLLVAQAGDLVLGQSLGRAAEGTGREETSHGTGDDLLHGGHLCKESLIHHRQFRKCKES